MIILLLTALLLSTPMPTSLLDKTSSSAALIHKKCLNLIPIESAYRNSLSSLVCGEKLSDAGLQENLNKTSLIHIFVVSGSHLILLDELLSILRVPLLFRLVFLGGYSLMVGWQAPVVRAFVGLGLRGLWRRQSMFLPKDLAVLVSGLCCLFAFPAWWDSLSLQMSWCAALALCLGSVLRQGRSWQQAVISQGTIFIFMSAPLWGFASLHPLSIVYNLFLAPIVSYVLLPLSFLCLLCKPAIFVFDFILHLFSNLLPRIAEPIIIAKGSRASPIFLWCWIFAWHAVLHLTRVLLWRGKDSV